MEGTMTKYIDAEKLRAEIDRRIVVFSSLSSDTVNPIRIDEDRQLLSFINSLQQEQPKEICHKCIHHGKDDDYCYNPHGGIQRLINENGVYECTGFYEKEEQPEMDLEKASRNVYESWMGGAMNDVRRDMVELGKVLSTRKEETK
jgi:hypothetical protein